MVAHHRAKKHQHKKGHQSIQKQLRQSTPILNGVLDCSWPIAQYLVVHWNNFLESRSQEGWQSGTYAQLQYSTLATPPLDLLLDHIAGCQVSLFKNRDDSWGSWAGAALGLSRESCWCWPLCHPSWLRESGECWCWPLCPRVTKGHGSYYEELFKLFCRSAHVLVGWAAG